MFYFSLDREPNLYIFVFAVCISVFFAFLFRRHHILLGFFICLLCFSLAIVNSSLRTKYFNSAKLDIPLYKVRFSGTIKKLIPTEKGARLVVKIHSLASTKETKYQKPKIVQLSTKSIPEQVKVGSNISAYADIHPVSKTLFPKKYDFSRHSYFNGVDAGGFIISKIYVLSDLEDAYLETMRSNIFHSLINSMGPANGKVAAALMIGEQGSVDENILEDMRRSGLSHILSVSGVHLSLVSIICFFVVRMILSNFVYFSHQYNIKKIAAFVSLFCTLFYLLISGMQIATVRSFIMVSFIITAVILDREEDAKRSLCFSALIILIIMPESIFHPSFQMSFSAVLGLVASYEFYVKKIQSRISVDRGILGKLKIYLYGGIFSSFIAGSSTAMFIIYHFNNYSHYSVLSNLASAPIVSFLIMPGVVITFLLMPFGLEKPGLCIMDSGISLMLKIAEFIAKLPKSISLVPTVPTYALIIFVVGFLWLTLWNHRWRVLGVIPIFLSAMIVVVLDFPSVIIDAKYKAVLVKDNHNLLKIGGASRSSDWYKKQWFVLTDTDCLKKVWISKNHYSMQNNGNYIDMEFHKFKNQSQKLSYIRIKNKSKEIVIKDSDLEKNGSYFIYLKPDDFDFEHAVNQKSSRPWS